MKIWVEVYKSSVKSFMNLSKMVRVAYQITMLFTAYWIHLKDWLCYFVGIFMAVVNIFIFLKKYSVVLISDIQSDSVCVCLCMYVCVYIYVYMYV